MDIEQIFRDLGAVDGISEVRRVETFKAYYGDERIVIHIEDAGSAVAPEQRYRCFAHVAGDPERFATGNPASSPTMAILVSHWENLDSP